MCGHGRLDLSYKFFERCAKIGVVDTVTACVGDLNTASVFDLADALGQRNQPKALSLFREVLTDGREAVPVLQALVSHFRRLWHVKELLASGMPESRVESRSTIRARIETEAVAAAKQRLGWRVYGTNQRELALGTVILAYRGQ